MSHFVLSPFKFIIMISLLPYISPECFIYDYTNFEDIIGTSEFVNMKYEEIPPTYKVGAPPHGTDVGGAFLLGFTRETSMEKVEVTKPTNINITASFWCHSKTTSLFLYSNCKWEAYDFCKENDKGWHEDSWYVECAVPLKDITIEIRGNAKESTQAVGYEYIYICADGATVPPKSTTMQMTTTTSTTTTTTTLPTTSTVKTTTLTSVSTTSTTTTLPTTSAAETTPLTSVSTTSIRFTSPTTSTAKTTTPTSVSTTSTAATSPTTLTAKTTTPTSVSTTSMAATSPTTSTAKTTTPTSVSTTSTAATSPTTLTAKTTTPTSVSTTSMAATSPTTSTAKTTTPTSVSTKSTIATLPTTSTAKTTTHTSSYATSTMSTSTKTPSTSSPTTEYTDRTTPSSERSTDSIPETTTESFTDGGCGESYCILGLTVTQFEIVMVSSLIIFLILVTIILVPFFRGRRRVYVAFIEEAQPRSVEMSRRGPQIPSRSLSTRRRSADVNRGYEVRIPRVTSQHY
ncbi:hepatitis A virus cellular receptor 1-like [Palaemon carinicauda]|uniref:hepatitis A virus cellular receptor 1-like n=1 Tax=Palaemon carinicauda TaxID=392227 RepID=UPI0035B671D4